MNQKSSLREVPRFVSWVLTGNMSDCNREVRIVNLILQTLQSVIGNAKYPIGPNHDCEWVVLQGILYRPSNRQGFG